MKILVVGQGGREHGLVRALMRSPSKNEVFCVPGNQGIGQDCPIDLSCRTSAQIVEFATQNNIEMAVIGPESYLVQGLADELRANGIRTVGPSQRAAQLEGSKIFAKEFMLKGGIPTARYQTASSGPMVSLLAQQMNYRCAIKVDGLAAGKGVFVCQDQAAVDAAIFAIYTEHRFGSAADRILVEELLIGQEVSYLVLTNGREYESLPLVKDHKRLKEKDLGPNTGGMGAIGPLALDTELESTIQSKIIEPTIRQFREHKFEYRGVLFVGIMLTEDGPKVLEYNVRFGDPETQTILPLLDGDWLEALLDVADGVHPHLQWNTKKSVCLVLASEGYPDQPAVGQVIQGLETIDATLENIQVLHAGTAKNEKGEWVTDGGRVLNIVAIDVDQSKALKMAYGTAQKIKFEGMQIRKDIGKN